MDALDRKAINQLMANARTTWAELGGLLGLSAPAAAERVHKLEEAGVIKGYAALVNPELVGCGLGALIHVTLDGPGAREGFLRLVAGLPAVQECHHVAGDGDYVLKVRCADTRELEQLISEKIKAVPGVGRTRTAVILSTVKETPQLKVK